MRTPDGKTNIAFTGVSESPFRDTAAEAGSTTDEAVAAAAEGVSILSDHYASEMYRKHLAKVYLKKALLAVS